MTTQHESYQKWRNDFESDYDQKPSYFQVWQAATAEANKRIAELQASNNYLREALVICKQFITEAILDDNYHEASCGLDEIYNLRDKAIKLSEAAISATPAESLQAHEIRGDNPDSKNRELVYAEAIHKYHKWVTT